MIVYIKCVAVCHYVPLRKTIISNIFLNSISFIQMPVKNNTPKVEDPFGVSSTNKTDRHDINEILLKVAFNTINQTKSLGVSLSRPLLITQGL